DPGLTFDLARNALADAGSLSRRSVRYDRILTRGLHPTAARLAGTTTPPPSDHFAVVAELALPAPRFTASPRTALALVPPTAAWGPLQRVRCAVDRTWDKWPPHVTLMFPFVDEAQLPAAAATLAATCRELAPFELALDHLDGVG